MLTYYTKQLANKLNRMTMTRTLLVLIITLAPFFMLAQNQPDEITSLKEKVKTLSKKDSNLQHQLTKLKKDWKEANESLLLSVKELQTSVATLNDSLQSLQAQMKATNSKVYEVENGFSSFKTATYVMVLLLLILFFVDYLLMYFKIRNERNKTAVHILNEKEALEMELSKLSRDFNEKLGKLKSELEAKIPKE